MPFLAGAGGRKQGSEPLEAPEDRETENRFHGGPRTPAILWKTPMDKSPLQLRPVPAGQIEAIWPSFAPILSRCKTGGEWNLDDMRASLVADTAQLLAVFDGGTIIAGLVYCIRAYPQMRALIALELAGTDGFRWGGSMLRAMEKIAAANDCAKVKFEGRKEWARVLAPAGYEAVAVSYEKVIACSARNAA
jgi:hypothetical protein